MSILSDLTENALEALADGLETGLIGRNLSEFAVRNLVQDGQRGAVVEELQHLFDLGASPAALERVLRDLARVKRGFEQAGRAAELVWTSPVDGVQRTRDARIAAEELFRRAERSVLLASYVVYNGAAVLGALANRMAQRPDLDVRFFVNVPRDDDDDSVNGSPSLKSFTQHLAHQWPNPQRKPRVFYDPRSLSQNAEHRASMHAKVVVVDERWVLVTSANLTDAAQRKNIEAGVLLENEYLGRALVREFEELVERRVLEETWV